MEKHFDLSASEVLTMEAVNYAIHYAWLELQNKWHDDIYSVSDKGMHRNIHPRVLKLNLDIGDIDVIPTDGASGPDDLGDDWTMVKRDILDGKGTGYFRYQLSRSAVATAVVTADHRENPVSFYMQVVVRGTPDNPDEGYKGHWWDWEVRGEVTEIETGQVISIYSRNECLNDRFLQRINGEPISNCLLGIEYFTSAEAVLLPA